VCCFFGDFQRASWSVKRKDQKSGTVIGADSTSERTALAVTHSDPTSCLPPAERVQSQASVCCGCTRAQAKTQATPQITGVYLTSAYNASIECGSNTALWHNPYVPTREQPIHPLDLRRLQAAWHSIWLGTEEWLVPKNRTGIPVFGF
jgi:hypothetical protein